MRIICLQENIKTALINLERVASRNQNTPILNNVLFQTNENNITLFTTDLEIGLDIQIPCKVEKKGEAVAPIRLISQFIQNLPNIKITIEVKGKLIIIESDNIKTTIPTTNKNDFPLIPKLKSDEIIHISPFILKTSLLQVLNSVSTSYSIPEISGILFSLKNDMLTIVSTDSFRLSEKTIYKKDNYESKKPHTFILPQKTAQELVHIIDQTEPIIISIEQNQISFKLENGTFISRLISGTYPNYEPIIPQKTKTKFILQKEEFISKIKLASVFSSKLNNVYFSVNQKKNTIEIKSADETKGEFSTIFSANISGESVEAAFNYRYILDGLSNISDEEVICELNGPSSAAIFSSKEGGYRYVVMPIKT